MESNIKKKFIEVYEPLLKKFTEDIKDVNPKNLPEPFLPTFGKNYEKAIYKIAFVGWETRDNICLPKFLNSLNKKNELLSNYYLNENNDINIRQFFCYGNKNGTSYSDFVLNFLGKLYFVDDWCLDDWYYRDEVPKKYFVLAEILTSFVLGNKDSIERFQATKNREAKREDWSKVKEASKIFDTSEHLLNIYKPNLLLIMRWAENDGDEWLPDGCSNYESLGSYLSYYFIAKTNTHVYWTMHPLRMNWLKINQNDIIITILQSLHRKGFSFPDKCSVSE